MMTSAQHIDRIASARDQRRGRATQALAGTMPVPLAEVATTCTDTLQRYIASAPVRSARECTGPQECARNYSLWLLNCSASAHGVGTTLSGLREQHERAVQHCRETVRGAALTTGGWCLSRPRRSAHNCTGRTETACNNHVVAGAAGASRDYWLADHHYTADARVVQLLSDLLRPSGAGAERYSLADVGAGVGQFCTALRSEDATLRCASYDGAGNVEGVTEGYVRWIDLTTPLALPAADYVVSLEVGEHVPNWAEPMMLRNLHAMNCRGIVLSWGRYTRGARGHGDVNYHTREYFIGVLEALGYRHRADVGPRYLRQALRPRHFWFDNNLVGVFERITPRTGGACTGSARL